MYCFCWSCWRRHRRCCYCHWSEMTQRLITFALVFVGCVCLCVFIYCFLYSMFIIPCCANFIYLFIFKCCSGKICLFTTHPIHAILVHTLCLSSAWGFSLFATLCIHVDVSFEAKWMCFCYILLLTLASFLVSIFFRSHSWFRFQVLN